jgi:hypothetical protein
LDLSTSLSKDWPSLSPEEARRLFVALIARIEVHPEKVNIHIPPTRIADVQRGNYSVPAPAGDTTQKDDYLILTVPSHLKRSGKEMKMLIEGEKLSGRSGPDLGLLRLIVKAHYLKEKLISGGGASLREIAKRERVESSYFTRILRLTFLAPDITKAILDGCQPPELTVSRCTGPPNLHAHFRHRLDEKISATQIRFIAENLLFSDVVWQSMRKDNRSRN